METPRIAPLEPPYAAAVAEDLAKLMPPGMEPLKLFRTLARNPRVLRRVRRGGLLDPGSVSVRDREIVILRTCARCGSEYEWGVHVAVFAGAAGLTAEQVAATAEGGASDPVWSEEEAVLVRLADELHETATISEELWDRLCRHRSEAQILELLVLAGLYHAISYVTNAARIGREEVAPRFP